ncbi:nucleotide exchange factor GrpE [Myxococcota bacterium]|nr:nucleotide exchange factor GrpE [Myxococcota bacterium]
MSQSEQKEKESNKAATEQRAAAETTKDAESNASAKSQSIEANASDIFLKTDGIGLESPAVVESAKSTTHASSDEPPQQAAASDSFAEADARSVETLEIPDEGPIASPPSSTARNESLVATASALQEEVAELKKKLQETRRTHLEEQLQHKRTTDDLKKQVADLKQIAKEKDELYERLLRLSADFDNLRKRSQREREDARKYGHEHLVKELLPMFDNFDLALKSMEEATSPTSVIEGLQLLYKQYSSILHHHGLQRFDAKGATFDYTLHEAISLVETDEFPDGTVCGEFRAGYKLHDRMLRPAMVAVAKAPTKPAEAKPSEPVDDAVGGGSETDAPPAQDIASHSDVPRGTEITDASKEEPEATAEKTDASSV